MTGNELLLWPDGAPGAFGEADSDKPALTWFPASPPPTGAVMVICPGGGYGGLAPHEGRDYALFLNGLGVACFVLKYRLGTNGYRHPCMLQDAARAVRLVRARAREWGLDPGRIGIMGSSAGGHLAATLLTQFDGGNPAATDPLDRESSRPDIGVLCYPVISSGDYAHPGSFQNLLGPGGDRAAWTALSAELNVTAQTPPCFVWHTWADQTVPVENSLLFAQALRHQGIPCDLHLYQEGRHGIGLLDKPPFANPHPWSRDLTFWLRVHRFVTPIT